MAAAKEKVKGKVEKDKEIVATELATIRFFYKAGNKSIIPDFFL